MPALSLSLAESALRDLEELRSWYAGQGVPEVGEREEVADSTTVGTQEA